MLRAALQVALVTLLACAVLTPAEGPGTEYPCGVRGVECADLMCCEEGEVCGGQPFEGCPAGACCFVGGAGVGDHRPHLQRRACAPGSCPVR